METAMFEALQRSDLFRFPDNSDQVYIKVSHRKYAPAFLLQGQWAHFQTDEVKVMSVKTEVYLVPR